MNLETVSLSGDNVMIALILDNRVRIAELCKAWDVRKLESFGSAATGTFDPASSDLDFIVDLGEYERGVARRCFGFYERLEAIVARPVDVITVRQIVNPYVRAELDSARELLYVAETGPTAS